MAGTSSKTKPVAVRLPVDLVEWAATQGGELKDVIISALTNLRDGPVVVANADAERVAKLEAEVATLTADRDRWRAAAHSMQPIADKAPVKRQQPAVARMVHGNPVLASAVPDGLSEPVRWSGLKGGGTTNAGKARNAG